MPNRRATGRCITVHKNKKRQRLQPVDGASLNTENRSGIHTSDKENKSGSRTSNKENHADNKHEDETEPKDLERVAQDRLLELLQRQGVELKSETRKVYVATRRLLMKELAKGPSTRWLCVSEQGMEEIAQQRKRKQKRFLLEHLKMLGADVTMWHIQHLLKSIEPAAVDDSRQMVIATNLDPKSREKKRKSQGARLTAQPQVEPSYLGQGVLVKVTIDTFCTARPNGEVVVHAVVRLDCVPDPCGFAN